VQRFDRTRQFSPALNALAERPYGVASSQQQKSLLFFMISLIKTSLLRFTTEMACGPEGMVMPGSIKTYPP
jgi:hypothetical protein